MSQGYLAAAKKPRDFEFVQAAPAGALSTTAADMSALHAGVLQDGTVDGVAILNRRRCDKWRVANLNCTR